MPGIEDEIRVRKEEIATLERRIELLRAQVDAFELALQYVAPPAPSVTTNAEMHSRQHIKKDGSYRGGRQQGAISNRWKTNLGDLLRLGRPVTVEDIAAVVAANEKDRQPIRPAEARRLFGGYADLGYVIENTDGSYSITEEAIEKFGLRTSEMETPPEGGASEEVGDVAERSIAPDSKSGGASGSSLSPVGSNPTISAHTASKLLLTTAPLRVGPATTQTSLFSGKKG